MLDIAIFDILIVQLFWLNQISITQLEGAV